MSVAPAIETFGLGKRYGSKGRFALKDLNLTIMPGDVYGFLGPNGAGKTTTIRLLMNFIQPTQGHALIHDLNVVSQSKQVKVVTGYLPGELSLYSKMTGEELLSYMQALHPPPRPETIKRLARTFEVNLNQKIGSLSKGNRQKIGIIQAFASEPEVLILDEPTAGLDPLMQEVFFELIRRTKARGAAVFLSSHNLSEVQKICDHVGFIRAGKLIGEHSINQLSNRTAQSYDVSFAEPVPIADLRAVPGAKIKVNSTHHATIRVVGDLKPFLLVLSRHKINSLDRQEINLEEEFLHFYRGGQRR